MKRRMGEIATPSGNTEHNILQFRMAEPRPNRLTLIDRGQASRWVAGPPGASWYIKVYDDTDEGEEIGDFISIYGVEQLWASWGVARRGDVIVLWETTRAGDLGSFPNMTAALQAISPSTAKPSPSSRALRRHRIRRW